MQFSRLIAAAFLATTLSAVGLSSTAHAQPAGYHGAVGRNLLLNPDFELGAKGWLYIATWATKTAHYINPEKQPSTILKGRGMDGGDCLYLHPNSFPVRSYCVPIEKGKTYTVSMYLKAPEGVSKADIGVLMVDPDWQVPLWTKQGGIGKEWTQYSWTFKWDKNCHQKRGYVNLGSSKGILVDRVLVTEGSDKTYEAPVMMALVGDRYPYFIRGKNDAKMTIRVAPGNLFTGAAKVNVVARDGWKRTVWTKTLDVTLDKVTDVPMDLPTDKLGNFHVDFEAVQNGQVIGRGVSRYTILDPPTAVKTAPGKPSPFGICQSLFAWPTWANAIYAPVLRDTGVQFNRFFAKAPRDLTHPFPKAFIDRQLALVKPAHAAGIDLMACIQFFPGSFQCGQTSWMPKPEELASYRQCVKDYVKALSPYVRYWEIFNEPDLWRDKYRKHRAFSPEKYALIQKTAYEAIKEVDPDLQVVCNALNTMRWKWMEAWWTAGGCQYMDFFSFHPYRSHPDQLNEVGVYKDILRARDLLKKHGGGKLGLINSEQLYGCNLFYDRQKTDEVTRGYFVDTDHELEAASRQVRNLIHHVASGAVCCPFTFREEFASLGPAHSMLIYDSIPAYNAATRFLATAGRGEPVMMGEAMRVFVFPDAKGGPLLAVWTPTPNIRGTMELAGDYRVWDMMGNPQPAMAAAKKVTFGTDPVWLRFKPNTAKKSIMGALSDARIHGVSEPLRMALAISGDKELTVHVTNLTNKPISGTIEFRKLPNGWKPKRGKADFHDVAAGKTQPVVFAFNEMVLDGAKAHEVTVRTAHHGEEYRRTESLRPFPASPGADRIRADGKLDDWKGIPMTTLGSDHISKEFSASQGRRGDDDLSAKVAAAWSPKALALVIVVTDDKHVVSGVPREAYKVDSVQVYLDQRNDASKADHKTADDISYILTTDGGGAVAWITKGAEGNFKGAANQLADLADPEAKVAIVRQGNTTVYELVLPMTDCLPNVDAKNGGGMGFSLLINDNDGQGRKTGLTLNPKGTEPYGRPYEYRDLILNVAGPAGPASPAAE